MKKVEKVVKTTRENLLNLLSEFRKNVAFTGVAFGHCTYYVDESGSKQVAGKKVLQKLVRTNVTIGTSYEKRVNRDLVKQEEEANFTAQSMSGKVYINDEGVIATDVKTGLKHYLICTVENKTKPVVHYFHEGKRIVFADTEQKKASGLFMPSYFEPKKTSGRGNVQEATDFHTISPNIDNIISLTLNKTKYLI